MQIDLTTKTANNPTDAFMGMFNIPKINNSESTKLPIDDLLPFPEHETFHCYEKEKLQDLANNILEYGVLSPVIVRPLENNKYQILAGHNRTAAAKMAGLSEIPAIIKECDDDTAKVIFVATNLNQREKLLPSEKAYAYRMLIKARRVDEVALSLSESKRQVYRYLRLSYLIKSFLSMVDDSKLDFMVGVNISYLTTENQKTLLDYMQERKVKIKKHQAEQIKELDKDNEITYDDLDYIFVTPCHKKTSIKLPLQEISEYFSDTVSQDEIAEKVIDIVREYFESNQ
jgi:ParB family chromosome partitioning protein